MPSKKKTAKEKRTTLLRKWGEVDERILEELWELDHLGRRLLQPSPGDPDGKVRKLRHYLTNTKRRLATAQATLKRIEGKLFFGKEAIGE